MPDSPSQTWPPETSGTPLGAPEETTAPALLFGGAVAPGYRRFLVPVLFQPYADTLATLLAGGERAKLATHDILEVASGTGVLTRAMAAALPTAVIVATDVSPQMLDQAREDGVPANVTYQVADATDLPFDDQSFDLVVSQFGVMFFPDRVKAFAEAARVLRPGGELVFLTWAAAAEVDLLSVVAGALDGATDGPVHGFLARGPYSYSDHTAIAADVTAAGLRVDTTVPLHAVTKAASPQAAAQALCLGSPIRSTITEQLHLDLDEAVRRAAAALADRFGDGELQTNLSAILVTATRPSH